MMSENEVSSPLDTYEYLNRHQSFVMSRKLINYTVTNPLGQLRPTRRPRAACSRVEGFVQSRNLVVMLYVQYNDNLSFFDNLKFDTFDAVASSAYLSCTTVLRIGRFPRITDTSV